VLFNQCHHDTRQLILGCLVILKLDVDKEFTAELLKDLIQEGMGSPANLGLKDLPASSLRRSAQSILSTCPCPLVVRSTLSS